MAEPKTTSNAATDAADAKAPKRSALYNKAEKALKAIEIGKYNVKRPLAFELDESAGEVSVKFRMGGEAKVAIEELQESGFKVERIRGDEYSISEGK